ncbi:MAG: hypothetical protein M0R17_02735 [Candidatus Omnitrophica bacterium]|jgi:hypothetical protein|nr:hypothetical protein [Candidatus Omnitrophota bacterium]
MSKIKSYCGINMGDKEIASVEKFHNNHLKCAKGNGLLQFIITPGGGIGATIEIRCIECGTIEDITTSETW